MVSVTIVRETETTLMLAETSLTTQASSLLSGLTETGSTPTGISAIRIGFPGLETSKTESRESGVLTAKSRMPSGERRIGLVCLPSKLTKLVLWARAAFAKQQANKKTSRRANKRTTGFIYGLFKCRHKSVPGSVELAMREGSRKEWKMSIPFGAS